jgi:hypothetical protein
MVGILRAALELARLKLLTLDAMDSSDSPTKSVKQRTILNHFRQISPGHAALCALWRITIQDD